MAKISLRNYNRFIENLVENGQHDEAIAHCRHILQTFPKYVEAYRLLGKSYLEAKRYKEAVDIFQRVLMAVPDDFVSHVGLSIIADDQNKLDDAIWHMERAFEVQPSNAAIQGELQRLFGRRDGVEPPKIRLTRGALAHMYIQGELYTQAVSEIRAVLANDPQRVDMQVLLAKAYYFMGQNAEATDSCSRLLKQYPYCLEANRILVEIFSSTQRADSAQTYRQRVVELEPYSAFARDSIFHASQVADTEVNVERLEYAGQTVDMGANWGSNVGIELANDATAVSPSLAKPDWLKQPATPISIPEEEPAPATKTTEPDQIPDFLRQAGWQGSSGVFQEGEAVPSNEAEAAPAPAVQADLPDWIKAMAPAAPGMAETSASATSTPVAPAVDVPDWLQNLDKGQPAASAPAVVQIPDAMPSSSDLPDWLQNLDSGQSAVPAPSSKSEINPPVPPPVVESPVLPAQPVSEMPPQPTMTPKPAASQPVVNNPEPVMSDANDPLGGLGKSSQEQDDALAWLESLAAKHGAKAEELVTDPNARTDTAPDWVDKAKSIGGPAPSGLAPASTSGQPPAALDDKTDMWFQRLEESEAETFVAKKKLEPEPPAAAESPDWMKDLSSQDAFSQISNEPAETEEETPILSAQETPDWLKDSQSEPAQPASPDVPDWLRGLEQPHQPAEPPAEQPEVSGSVPSVDLPAWLSTLDKEEEATLSPAGSSGELPSWLKDEEMAEPQTTEPTQPEEWRPVKSESQAVEPTQPSDWSVMVEPPAPAKTPAREISFEVERPQPVKRALTKASKAPKPAYKPEISSTIESAQSEMGRGNIGAAIDVYAKLIRKGRSLEEIIRDLRDALYRYPVEVPLWQVLGDAYMRANRLQEALDAYTKAEELLR